MKSRSIWSELALKSDTAKRVTRILNIALRKLHIDPAEDAQNPLSTETDISNSRSNCSHFLSSTTATGQENYADFTAQISESLEFQLEDFDWVSLCSQYPRRGSYLQS
jgi:hypothetical protein